MISQHVTSAAVSTVLQMHLELPFATYIEQEMQLQCHISVSCLSMCSGLADIDPNDPFASRLIKERIEVRA